MNTKKREVGNIEIIDNYTEALVKSFPNKIFVFGDNLARRGRGGQAIIRDLPNTFGIPTKRIPSTHIKAYFNDQKDEVAAVVAALLELKKMWEEGTTLVFPKQGFGKGLAKMNMYSPNLYAKMNTFLKKMEPRFLE